MAILISAIAVGIALWQTFLLRDQLTAADRNRAYSDLLQANEAYCTTLANSSIAHRSLIGTIVIRTDERGLRRQVQLLHVDSDLNTLPGDDDLRTLYEKARKLRVAFEAAKIWSPNNKRQSLNDYRAYSDELLLSWATPAIRILRQEQFLDGLTLATHLCDNNQPIMAASAWISGEFRFEDFKVPDLVQVAELGRADLAELVIKKREALRSRGSKVSRGIERSSRD
ncbi:hypothetical protein [Rhizobium sp. SL42]|uniref:hypothetical protein n=1 Tax=Rhizobium sp. SL42 TaxID=2806346 RepID=UPI001F403741|nr:hypothetical protein [Rhizobium sp. SL42]UJW77689.1 hypothetical protein IM739_22480 [Rhizobium sp. SL42]